MARIAGLYRKLPRMDMRTEVRETTFVNVEEAGESLKIDDLEISVESADRGKARLKITGRRHLKVIGENRLLLTPTATRQ